MRQLCAHAKQIPERLGHGHRRPFRQQYGDLKGQSIPRQFAVLREVQNGPDEAVRFDKLGGGSLASTGGGLRLDVTRDFDLDVEIAVPLTGERFDRESDAPTVNLRVQQSF